MIFVRACLVALAFVVIGVIVGYFFGKISSKPLKAGIVWINDTEEKTQYQLIFTAPLDEIPKMKECYFEIQLARKTDTVTVQKGDLT